jgi:DEAD/DEAH box helicase domain-containing protein
MNIDQVVERLQQDSSFLDSVTAWRKVEARAAQHAEWPSGLAERLVRALNDRGISRPYTHQASAIEASLAGKDVTVVTSTASGKTLCYNAPVLQSILQDHSSRALYLFPTKALSQDQYAELHELIERVGVDVKTYTYDGDTPVAVVGVGLDDPHGRSHRRHQPRHAARRHSAPPHQVAEALRKLEVRRR